MIRVLLFLFESSNSLGSGGLVADRLKNRKERFRNILEMLRYGIFFGFSVLSIRMVFLTLEHTPPIVSMFVVLWLTAIAVFTWWRFKWALYGFALLVPAVSGFKLIGLLPGLPLLSAGFAILFLTWFCKRLIWEKEGIAPKTLVGNLVDVLSAIILVSLIMQLVIFPADFVLNRLWSCSFSGQNDPLYGIDGSYVLLQGLFFFRVMDSGLNKVRDLKAVVGVFWLQTCIIICFSMLQLIARIPKPYKDFGILFSPFEDIHSYGSYVALLLFLMAALSFGKTAKNKFSAVLALFLLAFVFLTSSFATLGATLIVGCIYGMTQFRFGKIVIGVFVTLTFFVLLYANLNASLLDSQEGVLAKRYAKGLKLDTLVGKLDGRFMSWDQALGIIWEYPITGSGVGTFFRISRHYHFSDTPHPRRIENAHNYYLQLCADLGIPALLIFLGIILFTFKAGFEVLKKGLVENRMVKGLLFGASVYLITMLTGHPLLLSNQQFLFWFVIAVISVTYREFRSDVAGNMERPTGTLKHQGHRKDI